MKSRWSYGALAALLITGNFSMVMADAQKSVNIDEQIQQIESAPPGERYQLMNRFKMQLATMNRQERMHAIEALRSRMQGGSNKQIGSHTHTPMENLPDHVDFHRHNQMMQQGINEQMGQKQGMEEYMHEHPDRPFGSKGMKGGNTHPQIPTRGETTVPQTMPSQTSGPSQNSVQHETNGGTSRISSSPDRGGRMDTSTMPRSGMTTSDRR